MITRYFIIGSVLDDSVKVVKDVFKNRKELDGFLTEFDTYDLLLCLNKKQFNNLNKELKNFKNEI